jgi:predicted RNase H-like HicB family nuclease
MNYIYPAIFAKESDGGYSVHFPDLEQQGGYTCGRNLAEAMYMAEDVLGLVVYSSKKDKTTLPEPSNIKKVKCGKDEFVNLVNLNYPAYVCRVDEKPVRKTLYIPKKLNDQAEALNINFSDCLRQALKQRLNYK